MALQPVLLGCTATTLHLSVGPSCRDRFLPRSPGRATAAPGKGQRADPTHGNKPAPQSSGVPE